MGFFLELYQQLLGFVMYRLYTLQGLKYPPNLENGRLDELLDHLEAPESDLPQTVPFPSISHLISRNNKRKLNPESILSTLKSLLLKKKP